MVKRVSERSREILDNTLIHLNLPHSLVATGLITIIRVHIFDITENELNFTTIKLYSIYWI